MCACAIVGNAACLLDGDAASLPDVYHDVRWTTKLNSANERSRSSSSSRCERCNVGLFTITAAATALEEEDVLITEYSADSHSVASERDMPLNANAQKRRVSAYCNCSLDWQRDK